MMSNNTSSYMSGRMSSRGGRGRGGSFGTRDRFNERTNHTFSKKTEERELCSLQVKNKLYWFLDL
jgi:hypothetical protein